MAIVCLSIGYPIVWQCEIVVSTSWLYESFKSGFSIFCSAFLVPKEKTFSMNILASITGNKYFLESHHRQISGKSLCLIPFHHSGYNFHVSGKFSRVSCWFYNSWGSEGFRNAWSSFFSCTLHPPPYVLVFMSALNFWNPALNSLDSVYNLQSLHDSYSLCDTNNGKSAVIVVSLLPEKVWLNLLRAEIYSKIISMPSQ